MSSLRVMAPPIAPALPRAPVRLGLAGLLPQVLCLVVAILSPSWHWVALAAGCFYAALILSFLGGLWWMAGLLTGETRAWPWALAVLPSLAGWAALLPWLFGWAWPGPSLAALGLVLLASPLVDAAIARRTSLPPGWLRLRAMMAGGLGLLTLGLAAA